MSRFEGLSALHDGHQVWCAHGRCEGECRERWTYHDHHITDGLPGCADAGIGKWCPLVNGRGGQCGVDDQ